jgi:hypothetical protein
MAKPGMKSKGEREPRISVKLADTVPKIAVVPPCIIAVPRPRIALVTRPAVLRSGMYERFSSTASRHRRRTRR